VKPDTFTARAALIAYCADLPRLQCWEDAPDKRIKIQLRDVPPPEARKLLKANGFSYRSGQAHYWVRKLDQRGRDAAARVMQELEKMIL
jgi:hypothetical protein